MASKNAELAQECKRLSEGCLYTSTSFFIWLRILRRVKYFFIITPLVFGAVAGWNLLTKSEWEYVKVLNAICSFIAGLLPTVYSALKLDDNLDKYARWGGEFKNLQDRFRQAALVSSKKPFPEFEAEVKQLIERLEQARNASLTPPEWVFKRAQKKVKSQDYDYDIDIASMPKSEEPTIIISDGNTKALGTERATPKQLN
jgi:hypothetical protein